VKNAIAELDILVCVKEIWEGGFTSCKQAEDDGWLITKDEESRALIDAGIPIYHQLHNICCHKCRKSVN
jgi:hypothetical protein